MRFVTAASVFSVTESLGATVLDSLTVPSVVAMDFAPLSMLSKVKELLINVQTDVDTLVQIN